MFAKQNSTYLAHLLYPAYYTIIQKVRTNKWMIQRLFDVQIPADEAVSWDFTTLVLRKALRQRTLLEKSILEIGVGQGALLCLHLARQEKIFVEGVDIAPDRVESSRRVAEYNGITLPVWQSDMFENRVFSQTSG